MNTQGAPLNYRTSTRARDAQKRRGRPSSYSPALADRICSRLSDAESLRAICREAGMPSVRTVLTWAATRPDFRRQDARREIDALKWRMGRMTPKRRQGA